MSQKKTKRRPQASTPRQRPVSPPRPAQPRPSPRLSSTQRIAIVAGVLAAAIGALFVLRRTTTDDGGAGTSAVPVITHVHGLGINPADGTLVVATHTGTFRLPDTGPVTRIGGSGQDTMGFTVAGPNHYLGSGHPDAAGARSGQPGRLGLIESNDAGSTWTNRSLSGKVDFHALATSAGTTYGWDSGTSELLASTDNTTWETRATLQLYGFAVDPADVTHLVAGTPTGTQTSHDGARTWQPIPGAPKIVAVSWAPTGGLWGLDANGGTHHSVDAGTTWTKTAPVRGQPEALLALDDRLVAAVAGPDQRTAIYQSTDAGRTWNQRYLSPT